MGGCDVQMRNKKWILTVAGVLVVGVALSACGSSSPKSNGTTTTMAPQTTTTGMASSVAQIQSLSTSAQSGKDATFAATWSSTTSGTTTTLTLAQSPPKSLFQSGTTKIINNGTTTYICSSGASCISEPGSNPLASIEDLYDGQTFLDAVQGWNSQAVLQSEGVSLSFSTGSYGGVSSNCVNITKTGSPNAIWCLSATTGIMTYWAYGSASFTLESYTSSPPASDFTVPAG